MSPEEEEAEVAYSRDELRAGEMTKLHQLKNMLVKIAMNTSERSAMPFKSELSEELLQKFDQLKQDNMSYAQKTDLLSWFVDSMRTEVHKYFDETNLFNAMTGEERIQLCADLDAIHQDCADLLFDMSNKKAKGKHVENTKRYSEMIEAILNFKDRINLIQTQFRMLEMIECHNSSVSRLTSKYDNKKSLMHEFMKLDCFKSEVEKYMPVNAEPEEEQYAKDIRLLSHIYSMDREEVYPLLKRLEDGHQSSTRRDMLPEIFTPEMVEQEKL